MKRFFLVLFTALVGVGLTSPSYAGEFSIFGNRPVPFGDSAGGADGQKCTGWGAGASYTMNIKNNLFWYVEGAYHELPNVENYSWLSPMKVTEGSINLKYRTCGRYMVKPYILFGVGLAQVDMDVDTPTIHETVTSTELTLRAGGGLDFSLTQKFGLFAEAFAFESHNVSMIPLRVGIRVAL